MDAKTIMFYFFIVLPIFGAAAIICAFAFRRSLPEKLQIIKIFNSEIHAPAFTILCLIGAIFLLAGAYYWNKGYDREVTELKAKINDAEAQKNLLSKQLDKFKLYTLRFKLIFPERPIFGDPIKAQAYISRQNEGPMELTEGNASDQFGDIFITKDNLSPGDKIRFVVYDNDGRPWENVFVVEVPIISIEMRRSK